MGTGLSPLQKAIIATLDGTARRHCYSAGPLITNELMEELIKAGVIAQPRNRRQHKLRIHALRRACNALVRRGILTRSEAWSDGLAPLRVISWRIAEDDK